MFFSIFDDVFLLNLAFEAPESAFERFSIIQNNFRQLAHTSFMTRAYNTPFGGNCQG